MNRTLYTLLFHLGLPLVAIRLWLRARKAPAYAKRVGERFAVNLPALQPQRPSRQAESAVLKMLPRRWLSWPGNRPVTSPGRFFVLTAEWECEVQL